MIIYIHGGALIWGSRRNLLPEQVDIYVNAGFSVFTIDYRLAPETKLPEMITDVQDAVKWMKQEGKRRFHVDADKLAVIGSSAGGYLSLMSGTFPEKPKAIVSFYGYGDVLGEWYGKPSEYYCQQPLITREEAYSVVSHHVISEGDRKRFAFYLYCRQQGLWVQKVSGLDPVFHKNRLMKYCPIYNVTAEYPPALLIHGTADQDVPYEESYKMSQALTSQRIKNKFITVEGYGHAFDRDLNNPAVSRVYEQVIDFLTEHLQVD